MGNRTAWGIAVMAASLCVATLRAATPAQQKAIVQHGSGGPEVLTLQTVPVLQPGSDQVLVRVYATTVNPVDVKIRKGAQEAPSATAGGPLTLIPGLDVSGIVERTGPGVTGLKAGDPVFAVITRTAGVLNGAYAQFAVVDVGNVVPKPRRMTYAEAAGLGVAGVTGVRAVVSTGVARGQRVLVTGAAGGVGSIAVQAAKARGAYVIGTASAQHAAYLRSIGVDELVDYTKVKFEEKVRDVDVVIDTVGADTAERAFDSLKKGGRYVSIAAHGLESKCAELHVDCAPRGSIVDARQSLFDEVVALANAGKITVKIERTFPLAQAGAAQTLSDEGHTEGKIILIVDAAHANTR